MRALSLSVVVMLVCAGAQVDAVGAEELPGLAGNSPKTIGAAGRSEPVLLAQLPPLRRRPRRSLLAERVIPNPPLPPEEVTVQNPHTDDLLVGFVDLRKQPPKPKEHHIPAGTSKKFLLDRDAGATIERVYELITPAGQVLQQVENVPVPPVRIWDLVVWEYKITYQVAGQPELTQKSRRSIGVIPLPPGPQMPKTVDAFQTALDNKNPGAAAAYDNPKP